jgi:hypothetical protein
MIDAPFTSDSNAGCALGYNRSVRRLLGIVLLLLFSLPLIAPAFGLDATTGGSSLPACCRRNGAHHCMGNMERGDAATIPGVRIGPVPSRCPAWPAVITQVKHGDLSLHAVSLNFAEIVSHPSAHIQTEARARVALDRSRHKRGPPSLSLL